MINRPMINRPMINRPTINRPTINRPTINRPMINRPVIKSPHTVFNIAVRVLIDRSARLPSGLRKAVPMVQSLQKLSQVQSVVHSHAQSEGLDAQRQGKHPHPRIALVRRLNPDIYNI